jgi:hypothetical protein
MAEKIRVAELLMSLIFEHKLYITDEGSYSKIHENKIGDAHWVGHENQC